MSETPTARQPRGIPVGGQFATGRRAESGISISLDEAKSAAQRAIDEAYEAGIAEGVRRAQGEEAQSLDEVLDLSGVSLDDPWATPLPETGDDSSDFRHLDLSGTPLPETRDDSSDFRHLDLSGVPAPEADCPTCFGDGFGYSVGTDLRSGTCETCGGDGYAPKVPCTGSKNPSACGACDATGQMPPTPLGQDTVDVPGWGTFERSRDGVWADVPYAMRFEANRALSDEETRRLSQLIGYKYATLGRGEGIGDPVRDSSHSFVVSADTTKGHVYQHLDEFEDDMEGFLLEGSPVRKTNRAGDGTKGTRLVEGFGDPDLQVAVYYDSVDRA